MARPIKHTVDYFSHDAGSSGGKTLTILENHFGHEGYAVWFKLLENISVAKNHVIDLRNSTDIEYLSGKMRVKPERLLEILDKIASLEAIDRELWNHKIIWCQNFVDRLTDVYDHRKQDTPLRPQLNNKVVNGNINSISTAETQLITTETPQSKVKETKVKEIREETPLPPTPAPVSLSVCQGDIENILHLCWENLQDGQSVEPSTIQTAILEYSVAWIIEAIKQACISNNNTWGYVLGILRNCKVEQHPPGEARSAPHSSCAGCNHIRNRNGQPPRCAVGHHPPSKCEDYSQTRARKVHP
jgi:hypothetical protein